VKKMPVQILQGTLELLSFANSLQQPRTTPKSEPGHYLYG
jgi:hypothetical protein